MAAPGAPQMTTSTRRPLTLVTCEHGAIGVVGSTISIKRGYNYAMINAMAPHEVYRVTGWCSST